MLRQAQIHGFPVALTAALAALLVRARIVRVCARLLATPKLSGNPFAAQLRMQRRYRWQLTERLPRLPSWCFPHRA